MAKTGFWDKEFVICSKFGLELYAAMQHIRSQSEGAFWRVEFNSGFHAASE
jgi:hypothetical protein